ncbi:MAG: hypothetical protein AB7E26_06690 [Chryseobacterium sp.]
MSKKGVSMISGNISPIVGEKQTYHIVGWYPDTQKKNVILEMLHGNCSEKGVTESLAPQILRKRETVVLLLERLLWEILIAWKPIFIGRKVED